MLPAAAFAERDGHFTTWEGRGQRLRPVRGPLGLARPDWEIFQGVSFEMDADMGFTSLESVREEMVALVRGGRSAPLASPSPTPLREPAAASVFLGELESPVRADAVERDGDLTLFTYPLLVDEGRLMAGAEELKAALED